MCLRDRRRGVGVAIVALIWFPAVRYAGRLSALVAVAVLTTSGPAFVAACAVVTDPALAPGATRSMAAFSVAVTRSGTARRLRGCLVFVGLAIGLPATRPVATVVTLAPLVGRTLWEGGVRFMWESPAWVTGTALLLATIVLVVPREEVKPWRIDLVGCCREVRDDRGTRLVYLSPSPPSAEFCAGGRLVIADTPGAADTYFEDGIADFFVARTSALDGAPRSQAKLEPIVTEGGYELFRERRPPDWHAAAVAYEGLRYSCVQ